MSELPMNFSLIDALAGEISVTGNPGDYLADAAAEWAMSRWTLSASGSSSASSGDDVAERIASLLRDLTGHGESTIATVLTAPSREDALQRAIVLCRRHHGRGNAGSSQAGGENDPSQSRCLTAAGIEHGRGVVGRMLSGRADLRDSAWPLVPGMMHASLDSLHERIDDTVAMVLISPLQRHDLMRPVSSECLTAIRSACDRFGACLVIDHQDTPPVGGGDFWCHESIAEITADAVLMSSGLTGGEEGGLLVLNRSLADQIRHPDASDPDRRGSPSSCLASLIEASLSQWISQAWRSADVDEFATLLAERLARRECVRDLHVTGRSIGIELDVPANDWVRIARESALRIATAGEFGVRMQPPLIFEGDGQNELLDRIDLVFDRIEATEREVPREPVVDDENAENKEKMTQESLDEDAEAEEDVNENDEDESEESLDEEGEEQDAEDDEEEEDEVEEEHEIDDEDPGEEDDEDEDEDDDDELEDEDDASDRTPPQ